MGNKTLTLSEVLNKKNKSNEEKSGFEHKGDSPISTHVLISDAGKDAKNVIAPEGKNEGTKAKKPRKSSGKSRGKKKNEESEKESSEDDSSEDESDNQE